MECDGGAAALGIAYLDKSIVHLRDSATNSKANADTATSTAINRDIRRLNTLKDVEYSALPLIGDTRSEITHK
jgi:hypothetical protein